MSKLFTINRNAKSGEVYASVLDVPKKRLELFELWQGLDNTEKFTKEKTETGYNYIVN